MSVETFFSILGWVITGAVAGYVASVLLRTERQGCLVNVILGVAGAFVGGFVMSFLLPQGFTGWGFLDTIISATIGSVVILIALELLLPGRQLGVRKAEERSERGGKRRGFNPFDWLE